MVFFCVIVVGGVCIWQFPIDLMPKMDIPTITVMTTYEGAAPEDVETKVTDILERSLSTVPELKHITSTSRAGMSVIALNFEWGTDLDTRSNDVRDAVGMAKRLLPDEVDEPRVLKFDISQFPIIVYGVNARESYPHLKEILDDEVADPLKRLPGVGSAQAMVPLERQINVFLDRDRLTGYSLTPQDVVMAIAQENTDTPAGNFKVGLTDYLVRVPGEFKDVKPMEKIVVASRNAASIQLSDVATVEDGFKEMQRYIKINGQSGAILMVQKQSGANTVQVARAVKKRMEELKKRLPSDVQIFNVMDSSEDIERTIKDLLSSLLIGGLMTMAVVLIFLRRWRATLVIGLSIPFSLILAIVLIYFLGYTINMMTLFAMIIAVGMIVDNAIVILENITRHREEGERPSEGATYGASEVGMAVAASTLTTVCIFFPILFVKGITKILFTEFAIIVSVTLLGSLFNALTLTPMLSATLMGRKEFIAGTQGRFFQLSERAFDAVEDAYSRLLSWALSHRKTVIIAALLIFGGSLLLVPFLGSEFMPEEDQGMIQGTINLPVGTRVEETARVMAELERIIREVIPDNERIAVFTRCGTSGSSGGMGGDEGTNIGNFGIKLVPKTKRAHGIKEIAAALRKGIDSIKESVRIEKYALEMGDPMAGMLTGGEKPLTVNIMGNDMEATDRLAAKIKQIALETPGTIDISVSREKGRPELWVNVDRERASNMGLNVSDVGDTLRTTNYGSTASKYRIKGDEYDIVVRFRDEDRSNTNDLLQTPLKLPSTRFTNVGNVAAISEVLGPLEIERKDRGRIVNVMGNASGRSLGEVASDIESKIKKLDIPSGIEVKMAGQTEEQRESFFWLSIALVVGGILVYMVMASQFESLIDPFVVMFSIPFAFTGTIWALFLGGYHISVIVFLGLLLLIGVVVNNAIVLVDYINILRGRGFKLADAIPLAGKTRLRPVLMTAITTLAGLAPLAFGKGQGSEVWNPLGLTIFGGLLISTLVTLILVPTIYSIFESRIRRDGTH